MSVKKLHVAKCMKDLESQAEITPTIKNKSTNLLVSSADKVFRRAQEKYLDKDEETAYVQYVRFIELVLLLKKRNDFSKIESHKQLLENANIAISKAENLKESLMKRYSILEKTVSKENEKNKISAVPKSVPQVIESVPNVLPGKLKDEEKLSISSSQLHYLLTTGQSSIIIIMDTRSADDFSESHIRYSRCISVPQELLNPGLTAAKLESDLPKESLAQWYRRKEADYIILVDWESENEATQNIHLNSLKTAMSKWDQSCVLKKPPMVLKGGYKDWMRKYPMCTTQVLNFDLMNDLKISSVVTDLSGIEYPNLDENVNDEVQILNEKNSNGMLGNISCIPSSNMNGVSSTSPYSNARKIYSAPTVDRKSKPNTDIPNKSLNNENKSSKSMSQSATFKRNENSISEKKFPPPVDRKLKNTILSPVNDKIDKNINPKDPVLDSFNKEQSLAKESVEITNQKLQGEEEFEKLCLRKELEAEESKRIEIQKQEEILLLKLKQLEIQSKEKEDELLKVKEENMKIKKLLDDKIDKEYKREKEQEINNALKKQTALRENVEKLREERKRKEAESQKKKDLPSSIPRESTSANSALRRSDNNNSFNSPNTSEYTVPLSRQTSIDGARGLVRSHSSPNIAQMVNEEECVQHNILKTPSVDRSLKPKVIVNSQLSEINRARLRNLNPVYGNCPVRPATGLRNLGNTCFMNSVIQCLSNTIPLADYINSSQYVEHVNRDNKQGTGGELVEEFAAVIKALWMGQYKSFYPRDFKNTVSKCFAVCIGNEQQDSHEFLVVLMEKLHADLNRTYMKNAPKLESSCSESAFWQHHKNYNSSKISDTFDGLLKSTLTCLSCRKTSDSFEVFSCLSLPIMTSKCSLRECFQHFLRPEKISGEAAWDCPRCKQKKEAEKRLRICRAPEVLVIQLKRFSYEGLWRRKLQTHVDFDFNLEVPCEQNSRECSRMYSLYGIVNHYGTLEGGHYTAYCKTNTGKWFKFDDHEVSEMSSSDIRTSAAYLLFYITSDFQSRL